MQTTPYPGSEQSYLCAFVEIVDPFSRFNICTTEVHARTEDEAYNRSFDLYTNGQVVGSVRGPLVNWFVAPLGHGGTDFERAMRQWYQGERMGKTVT